MYIYIICIYIYIYINCSKDIYIYVTYIKTYILHDMCHMVFSKDFPTLLSPSKTEGRQ